MPRDYFLLKDDAGRWIFSDEKYDTSLGKGYRTHAEALDVLRRHLKAEGLTVAKIQHEDIGMRVFVAPDRPMLYSASGLRIVEEIRERVGLALKRAALERARRDGRTLVDDDDIWAAAAGLDWGSVVKGDWDG